VSELPPLTPSAFNAIAKAVLAASPLTGSVASYLAGRGLLSAAEAEGWGALGEASQHSALFAKAASIEGDEACVSSGLFDHEGRVPFAGHRLLIPWRNRDGTIATLQRRVIEGEGPPKYVFPRWLGPTAPYGIERLNEATPEVPITLVEGAIDVLAYRELDLAADRGGVVLGLAGVSDGRASEMPWAKKRVVRIAFDGDTAGDRATLVYSELLHAAGATRVTRVRPQGAKDWAEMLIGGSR
jgi:DNA primase